MQVAAFQSGRTRCQRRHRSTQTHTALSISANLGYLIITSSKGEWKQAHLQDHLRVSPTHLTSQPSPDIIAAQPKPLTPAWRSRPLRTVALSSTYGHRQTS